MGRIHTGQAWLDELMEEGLPTHTSTLISGPGGSGKPLIGNSFVAAWLRNAGSVVFMSLQYPSREFVVNSLSIVSQLDLGDFAGKVAFVTLDATIADMGEPTEDGFKANLVKPGIWDIAIERACSMVPEDGPGILVFGSALNLLLFSPSYGAGVLKRMKATVRDDKRRTYMFSVSTTAKKEEIAQLEQDADNLFMARSLKDPFRLFFRIVRLKDSAFSTDEVQVPIPPGALKDVKSVADYSRKRVIPLISKM